MESVKEENKPMFQRKKYTDVLGRPLFDRNKYVKTLGIEFERDEAPLNRETTTRIKVDSELIKRVTEEHYQKPGSWLGQIWKEITSCGPRGMKLYSEQIEKDLRNIGIEGISAEDFLNSKFITNIDGDHYSWEKLLDPNNKEVYKLNYKIMRFCGESAYPDEQNNDDWDMIP